MTKHLFSLIAAITICFTQNVQAQIAYIRDGVEVRVINPDGTNDRRLWTHPDVSAIATSARHLCNNDLN